MTDRALSPTLTVDPFNNTETDEETIAFEKKRARRVSFADNEITSIHIFNIEEESETPPGSDIPSSNSVKPPEEGVIFKCFSDLAGNSDEESSPPRHSSQEDDDEIGVGDGTRLFLRRTGSPSSGGSSTTAGSALSVDNDEDSFSGPVSASFIRSGRLSDSAALDDNHDLTMDSTAFSLHYRSIARSDSGDLKTPTRFGVSFVDKTPSQTSSPAKDESLMVLSKGKKQSRLMSADMTRGGRDSNDMSIVGDNQDKYEYDRLSPALDALLTEGSMGLTTVPVTETMRPNLSNVSKISTVKPNGVSSSQSKYGMELERGVVISPNKFVKDAPVAPSDFFWESYSSLGTSIDRVTDISLPNDGASAAFDASCNFSFQLQDQLNKVNELFCDQAVEPPQSQLDVQAVQKNQDAVICRNTVSATNQSVYQCSSAAEVKDNYHQHHSCFPAIDPSTDQPYTSPMCSSMDSSALRKQKYGRSPDPLRNISTPQLKREGSLLFNEDARKGDFLSSIRKSNSNFKVIESSPCMSSRKEAIDSLKCQLSKYSSRTSNKQYYEGRHVKPHVLFGEQLSSAKVKNGRGYRRLSDMIDDGFSLIQNALHSSQNEVSLELDKDGEFLSEMSTQHINTAAAASSPSQSTLPRRELMHFAIMESRCDNRKVESANVALNKSLPSPGKCSDLNSNALLERQISSGDQEQQKQNESLDGAGHGGLVKTILNVPSERIEWSSSPSQFMKVKEITPANEGPLMRAIGQSPARRKLELSLTTSITNEKQFLGSLVQDQLNDSKNYKLKSHVDDNQEPEVSQKLFHQQGIPVPSVLKRKGEEPLCNENHVFKMVRTERSSEVPENGACGSQMNFEHSKGAEKSKEQSMWKDWNEILMKFIGKMKHLDSSLYEKLDARTICTLEDILVHLLKVKKCEVICSELRSQKVADTQASPRRKRVVEARLLQYDVVYERAKLELMHAKHKKLLTKLKLLSSGIKDSRQLKVNYRSLSSRCGECQTNREDHLQSGLSNPQLINKVSCDKVITLKRNIEALDGKTKSLIGFFYTYCKMQGEPSSTDNLMLVHDYMKKKLHRKFIRDDLQLWEVEKLENRDGCYNFLLNYQGFMSQRILMNVEQSHSLRIANKLNMEYIVKSFPNVDADTAFTFVLDSGAPKTGVGSTCLAREMQKTNLLLHNLLEVLEEVQVAQIEIRNVIRAKFSSFSADTLNLDLIFIDFHSGRKLKATLDMTCLKCGMYPSEILPCGIEVPTPENQKSLLPLLVDKIKTSEFMQVKSSTILKLCQHFSMAVQTLNR